MKLMNISRNISIFFILAFIILFLVKFTSAQVCDPADTYYDFGNVGIGTNCPGEELEVIGNINSTGGDICISGGNCLSSVSTSAGLWTNDSGNAVYTAGNVGIGTNNPNSDLHVQGGVCIDADGSCTNPGNGKLRADGGLYVGDDEFFYQSAEDTIGTTDSLFVSGNVGIGISTPSRKLEVVSNGEIARFKTTSSGGYISFYESGSPRGFLGIAGGSTFFSGETVDSIGLRTTNGFQVGIGNSIKMTVDNNGIYTSNRLRADSGLYVGNDEYFWRGAEDRISTTDDLDVRDQSGGSYVHASCGSWGCTSSHVFTSPHYYGSASSGIINLGQSGNTISIRGKVGIGTSTPSPKLHVAGSIGATGWIGAGCEGSCESSGGYALLYNYGRIQTKASYGATCYKNGGSATFSCSSDIRLKENITDFNGGLKEIIELKPQTYFWKNDINKEIDIGFVAQEVQKVIPEAVTSYEENNETYLAVNEGEFIPYIINAIQELKAENDALKKELCNQNSNYAFC
jgi:endosialidase-like protein